MPPDTATREHQIRAAAKALVGPDTPPVPESVIALLRAARRSPAQAVD